MVPLEISMGNFRYVILQHFGYHNKKRVFGGIRGLFCCFCPKVKIVPAGFSLFFFGGMILGTALRRMFL